MTLSFNDLQTLTSYLAAGFETLLAHFEDHQKFDSRPSLAHQRTFEKDDDLGTLTEPSSVEISDWRNEIVKQINPKPGVNSCQPTTTGSEKIDKAKAALVHFKDHTMALQTGPRKCPVAHKARDQEDFEHDFTTQGKPGDLGCPFAKMQSNLPPYAEDPIAAEFHVEQGSTRSADAALGRCPIRFLDQHSPEEVAQYFENHKHEIPRSHEICVKRYQANETSIRQLDAKYGNLVSMIQGLGTKHKQFLPENEKADMDTDRTSNKAVEKWAENVSHHSATLEDTERVPRSDKPLRDIRVGESPSRPWGIQVPVNHSPVASTAPLVNGAEPSAKPASTVPAPPAVIAEPIPTPENLAARTPSSSQPAQIIFNGPVFFGYSAEQASVFLQSLGIGNSK